MAIPLVNPLLKKVKQSPKEECQARGWIWNEELQSCDNPNVKPLPTKPTAQPTPTLPPKPEGVEPAYVGQQQSVYSKGGVDVIIPQREAAELAPKNELLAAQQRQEAEVQAQEQIRMQQQIAQIGQLGKLSAAEQADINLSQAFTAGAARIIPSAAGAAAGGALIGGMAGVGVGSTVTAPLGAVIGAIGGTVTGFVSGVLSDIKKQQAGELQAADIELRNARTNMRQLAMLATQDRANADIYIQQYNAQLTRVHQARIQTAAEVAGDLNAFMEDGREQLADFDAFLQPGGIADVYGQKLAIALAAGTPLSINGEQLV